MNEPIGSSAQSRAWRVADVALTVLAFSFSASFVLIRIVLGWGVDVYSVISLPGAMLDLFGFMAVALCSWGRIFLRGPIPLRFGPAAATMLAVILVWPLALERRVTAWNFQSRLAARTEVVKLVRAGKIERLPNTRMTGCECFLGRLSAAHAYLSSGGIVSVAFRGNDLTVIFFVRRDLFFPEDDYTGFAFRSDGMPSYEDGPKFVEVVEWAPQWFFVVHS